ncbi:MAG: 1,4-dihydroxy-2-naphthoate octaprenyltransferase [Chlamydiota bacterium]
MSPFRAFIIATRPKTLFISICPVIIGTSLAPIFQFWPFFYTLLTALGIQITSHYASDYFDFAKDKESKKSFVKVLDAGILELNAMKWATIISALSTALLGTYLVWMGGPVIATCLALSLSLALLYNGGPYPLTYLGVGDFFAFAFYGPIATSGTYYLQTHAFSLDSLIAGISPGAIAACILMLNNLRDREEDKAVNKNTLAVRFGERFGKVSYLITMIAACSAPLLLHKFLPLLLFVPAFFLIRSVLQNKDSHGYHALLKQTSFLLIACTLLFCL